MDDVKEKEDCSKDKNKGQNRDTICGFDISREHMIDNGVLKGGTGTDPEDGLQCLENEACGTARWESWYSLYKIEKKYMLT